MGARMCPWSHYYLPIPAADFGVSSLDLILVTGKLLTDQPEHADKSTLPPPPPRHTYPRNRVWHPTQYRTYTIHTAVRTETDCKKGRGICLKKFLCTLFEVYPIHIICSSCSHCRIPGHRVTCFVTRERVKRNTCGFTLWLSSNGSLGWWKPCV